MGAVSAALLILTGSNSAIAATPFATDSSQWYSSDITLKLSQIKDSSFSPEKDKALFLLDGTGTLGQQAIDWWKYGNEGANAPDDKLYTTQATEWPNNTNFPNNEYITLNVKSDGSFNLGWDFADTASGYSPVIANFRNEEIAANSPDRYLKHFVFDGSGNPVRIISENATVGGTNQGNSESMLGLAISNKRGWMTFKSETYLISEFKFGTENTLAGNSGTQNEYIAAGVYTAFGATKNGGINNANYPTVTEGLFKQMFETNDAGDQLTAVAKKGLEKYGLIEFEERAVVLVNALPSSGEPNKTHEVFGVFSNEGGSVVFENGGDIIAKGRDNHHLVSAIAVASTYGVLDPLKLGTVTVQATSGLNRIWGWSDNYSSDEASGEDNTHKVIKDGTLFDEDGRLNQDVFENLGERYEEYLFDARVGTTTQTLRSAVIAANGAEVTLTDTDGGYFDIRGDIVSGLKNGEGAKSNTFNNSGVKTGVVADDKDMTGTVTRASVTINLSNPNSTLVGNVYERHRIGDSEAVQRPDLDDANGEALLDSSQSFTAWQQDQYEKEAASLGGSVELTLADGATWYPTKDWGGWNFDILYNGFISINQDGGYTINKDYELYDAADQYNLHEKDGDGYVTKNESSASINDLDQAFTSLPENAADKKNFKSVDNGVYHLALDDGIVDLYYLRNDFLMSTPQGDLGTDYKEDNTNKPEVSEPELTGEKRFRIQALSGTGGTIRMYAKNVDDHDIVIVDERRGLDNIKLESGTTNLNLEFWNTQGPTDLGVVEGDAATYIHVARVPEDVTITADSYGFGRTTYTSYRVEKDQKVDGEYKEGSWTWTQGQDWHDENVNWFVTSNGENKADLAVIGTTEAAANLGYMMATTVETLRDRRGEMRFNGTQEDGWWVRYTHNNFGMSGLSAETDGFQMGYEYEAARDEDGRTFRGFAIDAAQGDVEYSTMSGQSKANRYRASVYQTYVADDGFYYDLIGRAGWYDAETNMLFRRESNATLYNVKGDFDYWAAALSFETGKRWESDSAWWFEPEVQLQYTFIDGYDYGSSQGIQVDADNTHSLIGRLGLRAGKVFTNEAGRKMNIWIGADALHEWLGDREGSMKGVDQTIDYSVSGDDTWYNAVLGLTWETGADSRIWTTAKHTLGGEKDDCWSVNLGATWNF